MQSSPVIPGLSSPVGVAADSNGNAYIADTNNDQVLTFTYSASGFGPATTVLSGLSSPFGVAADWIGDLFISDTGNNQILMLPMTASGLGAPVTLCTGLNNPAEVAVDASKNVFVADTGNNRVVEIPYLGGAYGSLLVVSTGLKGPMGVAVDSADTLYIADTGNNHVLKVPLSAGGYVTKTILSGTMVAPTGLAVDQNLNLYIANTGNSRILEYEWSTLGRYSRLVGIGTGVSSPQGVVTDWAGNVFIADTGNNRVDELTQTLLPFPAAAVGQSAVPQTYNFTMAPGAQIGAVSIYTQGVTGEDFTDAGSSTCTAQTYASTTQCAVNVAFGPLVSGLRAGAIVFYSQSGSVISTYMISGTGLQAVATLSPGAETFLGTQLSAPSGVAVDGSNNLFIADTGNNRVVELPWTGSGYGAQVTLPVTGLNSPIGLAFDGAGNLYIVSNGNDKVLKLPWLGSGFGPAGKFQSGFYAPTNVAIDSTGTVYVSDTYDNRVRKFTWTGTGYLETAPVGQLARCPWGVAVNQFGGVMFANSYSNVIGFVPFAGGHYLLQRPIPFPGANFPTSMAVDPDSNLYLVDTGNNRLVLFPWNGTTYGTAAVIASGFNGPSGLAVDTGNHLFVADTGNNQIVRIDLNAPAPLLFADTYVGSSSSTGTQAVSLRNVGNQPLSLNEVTYPSDFPEDPGASNACTGATTLGQSQSCAIAMDFAPAVVGQPLQESVTVAESAGNGDSVQQGIAVIGNGLATQPQTITFSAPANLVYGIVPVALGATSSSGLPVSYQVVSGPGTIFRGSSLTTTGAGVIVIEAQQPGNSGYAAAAPVALSLVVAPAALAITVNPATATYGNIPVKFGYSITGFIGRDTASSISGAAAITSTGGAGAGVGSYALTPSLGTLASSNYTFTFFSGVLTVNSSVLTVTPGRVNKVYGAILSPLTYYISGFVNGDTVNLVSGSPALATTVNIGSAVGSYPIQCSLGTLSAANYKFTCLNSLVVVRQAALIVVPVSQVTIYGQNLPALSYNLTGFSDGDTAATATTGSPTLSTIATASSPVGTYPITATAGTLSSANYTFTFTTAVLSVQKAVLVFTASNASMIYGQSLPAFSFTEQGLVNGDTAAAFTGTPRMWSNGTSASQAGSYSVFASAGSLASKNYSFAFLNGALTIGDATLLITPNAAAMTYGGAAPALGYTISGFVNKDKVSVVSGAPLLSATATSGSPTGTYPITGVAGTLTAASYTFSVGSGTLTVTPAVLVVSPNPSTMIYGGALPAFSFHLSGFLNGDSANVVSGTPQYQTNASATTPVGSYPVQASVGTLSAANYTFSFAAGTIAVTQATLTVTANSATMTSGSLVPALTYTVSGFVNGDTVAKAVAGAAAIATVAPPSAPVGSYPIIPSAGTLTSRNYQFAFVNGTLTVQQQQPSAILRLGPLHSRTPSTVQ